MKGHGPARSRPRAGPQRGSPASGRPGRPPASRNSSIAPVRGPHGSFALRRPWMPPHGAQSASWRACSVLQRVSGRARGTLPGRPCAPQPAALLAPAFCPNRSPGTSRTLRPSCSAGSSSSPCPCARSRPLLVPGPGLSFTPQSRHQTRMAGSDPTSDQPIWQYAHRGRGDFFLKNHLEKGAKPFLFL